MKLGKVAGISLIVTVIALSLGYRQGVAAADKQIAPAKVAIVDISKILQNSQKHKQWQQKMTDQETQMKGEFQKDKEALEVLQKNLDLLNLGSKDYVDTMKEFLDKKSLLEAKDKFYQEKVNLEMLQWTENLYKQMLDVTSQIAQKKGLDIVLAQEELDTQSPSLRDLMLNIRTKKVLYCTTQIDITAEVLAVLDETK